MNDSNLPLAADLRRMVRHKARVWKVGSYWTWSHDCGEHSTMSHAATWFWAVHSAVEHVKKCRS